MTKFRSVDLSYDLIEALFTLVFTLKSSCKILSSKMIRNENYDFWHWDKKTVHTKDQFDCIVAKQLNGLGITQSGIQTLGSVGNH